jgi:hypothetical protein
MSRGLRSLSHNAEPVSYFSAVADYEAGSNFSNHTNRCYPHEQEIASMNVRYITLAYVLMVVETAAGNSTMDTAIGGSIGNAAACCY